MGGVSGVVMAAQLTGVAVLAEGEKKGLYWDVGAPFGLTSLKLLALITGVYVIGLIVVVFRPRRRRGGDISPPTRSVSVGDTNSSSRKAGQPKSRIVGGAALAVSAIMLQFLGCLIVLLIANRIGGFFASFEDLFGAPGA